LINRKSRAAARRSAFESSRASCPAEFIRFGFVIAVALDARESGLLSTRQSGGAITDMMKSVCCSGLLVMSLAAATPAAADDLWGCEVLLCLANPGGWSAIPACHPPMARLRQHLARKRPFPSCPQASAPAAPVSPGGRS